MVSFELYNYLTGGINYMEPFGNIFKKRYENISEMSNEEEKAKLAKLRKEKIGIGDILALIIAMFQVLLPFLLFIVLGYFIIIKFLTVFWIKYDGIKV